MPGLRTGEAYVNAVGDRAMEASKCHHALPRALRNGLAHALTEMIRFGRSNTGESERYWLAIHRGTGI